MILMVAAVYENLRVVYKNTREEQDWDLNWMWTSVNKVTIEDVRIVLSRESVLLLFTDNINIISVIKSRVSIIKTII